MHLLFYLYLLRVTTIIMLFVLDNLPSHVNAEQSCNQPSDKQKTAVGEPVLAILNFCVVSCIVMLSYQKLNLPQVMQ